MSASWKLTNTEDGSTNFARGSMDIEYGPDGKLNMLTDGDVLDQRVKKGSATIQGSNPFAPAYGTRFREAIGRKLIPGGLARDVGSALTQFVVYLERSQAEVSTRRTLSEEELIDRIKLVRVTKATNTKLEARVIFQVKKKDQLRFVDIAGGI